jgi:nitrite reductase/ring-hydroxylating ferredoxin subunit
MTADDAPLLRQVSDDLVLVRVSGQRVLAAAACPHRGGRLLFGHVNGRTLRITCPLHQSTFDLRTGERLGGPACDPLRIVEVLADDAGDPPPWTGEGR